jgi:nucleotide-binding universal stress UspA family protein
MKTILVLTDFSINSEYTAHYALKFAQKIKANLLLCNVYTLPVNEQRPDQKKGPLIGNEKSSVEDLGALMAHLKTQIDQGNKSDFRPEINQYSEDGLISETIDDIVNSHHIFMAIVSAHSHKNITSFLKTNHVWAIIKKANFPLLIIPYQVRYKDYKKIAFATDLNGSDVMILNSLISLACYSAAEIVVINVTNLSSEMANEQIAQLLKQDSSLKNNPGIIYHSIKEGNVRKGLMEFAQEAEIDMIVLIKRSHNLFENFLKRSIIQELADCSIKPVLIFPDADKQPELTLF